MSRALRSRQGEEVRVVTQKLEMEEQLAQRRPLKCSASALTLSGHLHPSYLTPPLTLMSLPLPLDSYLVCFNCLVTWKLETLCVLAIWLAVAHIFTEETKEFECF